MKSCAVIFGLLIGCIVAAAAGYFSSDNVDAAPAASFMWVHTFKLTVYGPVVLPFLAVYIVLMMECIGDVTATSDVSRLPVSGEMYESRIQGGVLGDGICGILSTLMTMTPMSVLLKIMGLFQLQNVLIEKLVIVCIFLNCYGSIAKFAGAITSIPKPVLGGMTSFLFCLVAISGIKIISTTEFTRRDRFVLTAAVLPGLGATMLPNWFEHVFTYQGGNKSLKGFSMLLLLLLKVDFVYLGLSL